MATTPTARTRRHRAAVALEEAREAFLAERPWCEGHAFENLVTMVLRLRSYSDTLAKRIASQGLMLAGKDSGPKKLLDAFLVLSERLKQAEAALPSPPDDARLRPVVFAVNGAEGEAMGALSDAQLTLVRGWIDRSIRFPEVDELDAVTAPVVDLYHGDRLAGAARYAIKRLEQEAGGCCGECATALSAALGELRESEASWSRYHPPLPVARPSPAPDPDAEQEEASAVVSGEDATLEQEQAERDEADRQAADLAALDSDEEEV